jgi:hypothetical protein
VPSIHCFRVLGVSCPPVSRTEGSATEASGLSASSADPFFSRGYVVATAAARSAPAACRSHANLLHKDKGCNLPHRTLSRNVTPYVTVGQQRPSFQAFAELLSAWGDGEARRQPLEKFPTAAMAVIDFPFDAWDCVHPRAGPACSRGHAAQSLSPRREHDADVQGSLTYSHISSLGFHLGER